MGYRIEYQPVKKLRGVEKRKSIAAALTAVCFLLFVLLTYCFWPDGIMVLRDCLLPGNAEVTASALENLTRDLKAGEPLGTSVAAFCQTILQGANLDPD